MGKEYLSSCIFKLKFALLSVSAVTVLWPIKIITLYKSYSQVNRVIFSALQSLLGSRFCPPLPQALLFIRMSVSEFEASAAVLKDVTEDGSA